MTGRPIIDVNLFVHNGATTIAEVLDSVLAQSWPDLGITVIDNASTDDTATIVAAIAARDRRVHLRRNHANIGPVLNCQRAFWHGDADFVMPKTADDLLAPDFVASIMAVLQNNPEVAMCHAAGLVFGDDRAVSLVYPPEHRLAAIGADPIARARHVMARYTSAPAFWGIYRRAATDLLAPIQYRPGWDHAVLAELALHGEIRCTDTLSFWRRHGGKDVNLLAPGCSQFTQRNLPLDDGLADLHWRLPLVSTAYAHIERFAIARLDAPTRRALMDSVAPIFRQRWLPMMRREAARFRHDLPSLLDILAQQRGAALPWAANQLAAPLAALRTVLPEEDFADDLLAIHAVSEVDQGSASFFEKKEAKKLFSLGVL